jgi:hypothetical protein
MTTMTMAEKKAKWIATARVIYWTETLIFCMAMLSGGILMLIGNKENVNGIEALGYPAYLCQILGVFKILGVGAVLWGKNRTLKEWAYAGFTFLLLGATASHIFHHDELWRILVPPALLALVLLSRQQWRTGWM